MTTITGTLTIGPEQAKLLAQLTPDQLAGFLQRQAPALVAQVRANIVRDGARAGTGWAPLSAPYAKRKRTGKTPGAGKHKYAMLRDTGELYASLKGEVRFDGRAVALELTAEGGAAGRPSNAALLAMHAEGAGNLPPRNPALHMDLFEKRVGEALAKHLEGYRVA